MMIIIMDIVSDIAIAIYLSIYLSIYIHIYIYTEILHRYGIEALSPKHFVIVMHMQVLCPSFGDCWGASGDSSGFDHLFLEFQARRNTTNP